MIKTTLFALVASSTLTLNLFYPAYASAAPVSSVNVKAKLYYNPKTSSLSRGKRMSTLEGKLAYDSRTERGYLSFEGNEFPVTVERIYAGSTDHKHYLLDVSFVIAPGALRDLLQFMNSWSWRSKSVREGATDVIDRYTEDRMTMAYPAQRVEARYRSHVGCGFSSYVGLGCYKFKTGSRVVELSSTTSGSYDGAVTLVLSFD